MTNVLTRQQPDQPGPPSAASRKTGLALLFGKCDPVQARKFYAPERRSFRIHGHSTTIRLEQAFWETLESIAEQEGQTIAGLINRIHDHCQIANEKNLASCLRVICLKCIEMLPSPPR